MVYQGWETGCEVRKKKPNIGRLCCAGHAARRSLEFARIQRREAVREYVGSHWSEEGAREPVPVNLISLYLSIMGRQLVAKNPRAILSTFERQHWPVISAMQDWINTTVEEMDLAQTLRRVVTDALFSIGIAKVAIGTPADSARFAWQLKAGIAFCERVDLDDFVFDVHARDFSEVTFIGHRFRAPLDVIQNSDIYNKQAKKRLVASTDNPYNREGDERINMLGRGYALNEEEFEDMVDLWEIYLPQYRTILTLSDDQFCDGGYTTGKNYEEPLRSQQWIGPATGPYKMLAYGIVPGNAMPKSPIQDLIDLHCFNNNVMNKLMDQARRQKEITGVRGDNSAGDRVTKASDGDAVHMDDPQATVTLNYGGPDTKNFQMFQASRDLFKELAGNLDAIGGLSPGAKTYGQDKLLSQSASKTVGDLQERTIDYTADVLKSLCWFWHHDPFKVMKSVYAIDGLPEFAIQRKVTPRQRMQVNFEDLKIKIDPYSMQYQTPQARLQALMAIVGQSYMPLAQIAEKKGVVLDMPAYFKEIANLADLPQLMKVLTITEPSMDTTGGNEQVGPAAPPGDRTVTRDNVSSQTNGAKANEAGAAMAQADGETQGGMQP